MKLFFKKLLCSLCSAIIICSTVNAEIVSQVTADVSAQLVEAQSAILTEASTGEVLYQLNPDQKLPIASVTKTMTMLLIAEALDGGKIKLSDMVTTSEYAASMGGSQVFLEVGETMSVEDMLKSIVISSGNDAAVAMAEFIAGTEPAFVEMMNKRAGELGCKNTHFINCNGLDETAEHYSCARDIAIISREILKHPVILNYTTIWMDTIRGGEFGLSNTNKLIRFYKGANGLKTGSTSIAKYCLSATAKRNDMQLIAVILAAPTSPKRFAGATSLLDYGFANYSSVNSAEKIGKLAPISVTGGKAEMVNICADPNSAFIIKKGNMDKIQTETHLDPSVKAPITKGQKVGSVTFKIGNDKVAECNILATEAVERMTVATMFWNLFSAWLCAN